MTFKHLIGNWTFSLAKRLAPQRFDELRTSSRALGERRAELRLKQQLCYLIAGQHLLAEPSVQIDPQWRSAFELLFAPHSWAHKLDIEETTAALQGLGFAEFEARFMASKRDTYPEVLVTQLSCVLAGLDSPAVWNLTWACSE